MNEWINGLINELIDVSLMNELIFFQKRFLAAIFLMFEMEGLDLEGKYYVKSLNFSNYIL